MFAATEVCKVRGDYVWTVRGFSAIGTTRVYSGEFELMEHKWRLYTRVAAGNVFLFLENAGTQATVTYWLQLLDTQGRTAITRDDQLTCFQHRDFVAVPAENKYNAWGWAEFVKHSELIDEKKGWFANDTVTFKVIIERDETASDGFASMPKSLRHSQVSQAMQSLLDKGSHRSVGCWLGFRRYLQRRDLGG